MADSNIRLLIEMSGFQLHEKVAGDILTACSHNVEVALNEYFNNSSHYLKLSEKAAGVGAKKSSPSKSLAKDKSKASSLFKKYNKLDSELAETMIGIDGILQLCQDLKIEPEDRRLLLFSWQCRAAEACQFTKSEFLNGLKALNAESTSQLAKSLTTLNQEIDHSSNRDRFKDLYLWVFEWARNKKQKSMDVEEAVVYWKMLFLQGGEEDAEATPNFKLFHNFLTFITQQAEKGELKVISKDQWKCLIDFASDCHANIESHSEFSAWPVLFDEYVAWYRQTTRDKKEERMEDRPAESDDWRQLENSSNMMF